MITVGQSLKSKSGVIVKIKSIVGDSVTVIFSRSQTESYFSLRLITDMIKNGEYVSL